MDINKKDLVLQMKAALVFAVKMLWQTQQYTSKHCTDCMMNRYRTECTISYVKSLCPDIGDIAIGDDTKAAINAKCREIEEACWKHQGEPVWCDCQVVRSPGSKEVAHGQGRKQLSRLKNKRYAGRIIENRGKFH
jgi:hypothetical protein